MPFTSKNLEELSGETVERRPEPLRRDLLTENYSTSFGSKPNAIVRPLQRQNLSFDDPGTKPPDSQDIDAQIVNKFTADQKRKHDEFTKDLDAKLSRISREDGSKKSSKNVCSIVIKKKNDG